MENARNAAKYSIEFSIAFSSQKITKPRGYAIQHVLVLVPSQDKLGGLWQKGRLA